MTERWNQSYHESTVEITGSGALAYVLDPGKPFQLIQVEITINTAPTTSENLTIIKDALAGSDYDLLIVSEDMAGVSDYLIADDPPLRGKSGDKLNFDWTNTDGRTWTVTIRYRTAQ